MRGDGARSGLPGRTLEPRRLGGEERGQRRIEGIALPGLPRVRLHPSIAGRHGPRREGPNGRSWRVRQRPTEGNIKLWVPRERVYAFCRRKRYGNLDTRQGRPRPQFLDSSDLEIITAFNSELRGFANYYCLADGVKNSLRLLELVTFRSFVATLASRHRTTMRSTTMRRAKDVLR